VTGIDLHMIWKVQETRNGHVEEDGCPLLSGLRQVRASHIAHEHEVGRENEPGLGSSGIVVDEKVDLLGAMSGHVDDLHPDATHLDEVSVLDPGGLVSDLGSTLRPSPRPGDALPTRGLRGCGSR
jgi:hypothetical protein